MKKSIATLIINTLHKYRLYLLNCIISKIMHIIKYKTYPSVKYYYKERLYETRWNKIVYISERPGLNMNINSLSATLKATYCYFYAPQVGDVVIDFGTGMGEEAVVFGSLVGDFGRVVCIEANPLLAKAFNLRALENFNGHVTTHNIALAESNGIVTINVPIDSYVAGSTVHGTSGTAQEVVALTFDEIFKRIGLDEVNFLKMNIEGAEGYMNNINATCIRKVNNLCISCHDFRHNEHQHGEYFITKSKVKSFLLENGFEIFERHSEDVIIKDHIYAKRLLI